MTRCDGSVQPMRDPASGKRVPSVRPEAATVPRLTCLPGGLADEGDGAAYVATDDRQLIIGELLEVLPPRFQHGYKRFVNLLAVSGIKTDHNPAAVLFIALAADEIEAFETIDESGDRAC